MNVEAVLQQKRLRSTRRRFAYEAPDESDALKRLETTFFNVVVDCAIQSLDDRSGEGISPAVLFLVFSSLPCHQLWSSLEMIWMMSPTQKRTPASLQGMSSSRADAGHVLEVHVPGGALRGVSVENLATDPAQNRLQQRGPALRITYAWMTNRPVHSPAFLALFP
ncbi:hypothetical protein N1851_032744 [Merluccius polli]|uniref:Uncharacterized protein n=1 Tax=Merluccius polli TaxID=89951 RepID=A0AA47NP81_MERPO|nr:hypothetical protein N1851_032744 [Merluccius polli]